MTNRVVQRLGISAIAGLLYVAPPVSAQTITTIPPFAAGGNSVVRAINSNGTAAAGHGVFVGNLFFSLRWTSSGGSVGLGTLLSSGGASNFGTSMDSTGTIMAGHGEAGGVTRAYRWTTTAGFQLLPYVSASDTVAFANGISASGTRIVGQSGLRAYVWDVGAPAASVDLGVLPGHTFSVATSISADGSTIAGRSGNFAVRWVSGVISNLGSLPGQSFADALAVNADGSVITGRYGISGVELGFRWALPTGLVSLPALSPGHAFRPSAINADGNFILGSNTTPSNVISPVVWTPRNATQDLAAHLAARGVNLASWTLTDVTTVNAGGTAIGGNGVIGGQGAGWVVTGLACPSVTSSTLSNPNGCRGSTLTFNATGTGAPTIQWRWFKNGVPLADGNQSTGSVISGALTSSMTLTGFSPGDGGGYQAAASAVGACEILGVSLPVPNPLADPVIVVQPTPNTACNGQNPSLFAAATVSTGSVQFRWQGFVGPQPNIYADIFDGPTGNGSSFFGTGTSTFSIINAQPADTRRYRCVISDSVCGSASQVVTDRVLFTINPNTTITADPSNTTVCIGDNDAFFTVSAIPAAGPLTYQWQRRIPPSPNVYGNINDGPTGNGGFYGGTQTSTLTVAGVYPGDLDRYRCVVTGPCGLAQTSANALLSGAVYPSFATQPVGGLVCNFGSKSLSVTPASGNFGTLNYQWLRSISAGPFTPLANGTQVSGSFVTGAQTPNFTITQFGAGDTGQYLCRLDASCDTILSSSVTLTRCVADFNCDGTPSPADIFAFLNAYFSFAAGTDINGDSLHTPADIFAFLNAYFAGC